MTSRRPLPSTSWVNTHLQYTHGTGAALAESNQTTSGNPVYGVGQIPPQSSPGLPQIKQPNVYFGQNLTGFVVANTKQLEVDYQKADGDQRGEPLPRERRRPAFVALQTGGLRAAPGRLQPADLEPDHGSVPAHVRAGPGGHGAEGGALHHLQPDPYAVITNKGHIDWIVDGYTTTANYAYSQNADTQQVAVGSNLPASYNYVRNSVKVVIDAYSGKMTFYDADPNDPILQAYESAFPHMFTPISKMPAELQAHLRYPPDIFSIQSAIYGRYHLNNPGTFYAASNAWQLSPTAGAGPQSQALLAQNTYNSQGQLVSTTPARMSPQYQVYSLPAHGPAALHRLGRLRAGVTDQPDRQQPELQPDRVDGRASPTRAITASSTSTRLRRGPYGPANADAEISANKTVSSDITLLDQNGSEVLLGETLMVPIANSMVYLRPIYVSPTTNPQPQLQIRGGGARQDVQIDTSLSAVLSTCCRRPCPAAADRWCGLDPGSSVRARAPRPARCRRRWRPLQQAQTDYKNALAALKANNLASSRPTSSHVQQAITQAQQAVGAEMPTPFATTTTTTAPAVKAKKSKKSTSTTPTTSGCHRYDLVTPPPGAGEHEATPTPAPRSRRAGLGGAEDRPRSPLSGASRPRPDGPGPLAGCGRGLVRPMMGDGGTGHRKGRGHGTARQGQGCGESATEMAKDAAAKGQAKMNEVQAKKAADGCCGISGRPSTPRRRPAPRRRRMPRSTAGRRPAGARVRARPDHPGPRVRGGRPTAIPTATGSAPAPPKAGPTRPRHLLPRQRRQTP